MIPELDKPEIYRKILESLQTGIYLVDQSQKILFWNDGAERITGHLRQDVLGRFCVHDLLGNRDGHDSFATDAADAIGAVLRDGKPVAVDVSLCHKEGHRLHRRGVGVFNREYLLFRRAPVSPACDPSLKRSGFPRSSLKRQPMSHVLVRLRAVAIKVSVTASFGGTASVEGDTVESIVSRAEAALRAGASASGRGIKVLV